MVVSDGASAGPSVEIDSGPLYELLLSLLVFGCEADAHSYDVGLDWFTAIRARASPELLSAVKELAPRHWMWLRLLVLACETHERKQPLLFSEFIQRLRQIEAARLYGYVLGDEDRPGPVTTALVQKAMMGNRTARLRIGRALFREEPTEYSALDHFLALPPQRVKDLIVRIISEWYLEIFREHENDVALRLAGEARTKRVIGRSSPTRLLRAAATGFHYFPRRTITRVLLIPCIVCRPWVVTTRFGSTRVFFYPVAEGPAGRDTLSAQLVKIHRALADFERLRILRALIPHEGTLSSLSRELSLPSARTRAQLVILRDAGLVMLRMDERRTTFEIRHNLASMVFRKLQSYLPGSDSTAA